MSQSLSLSNTSEQARPAVSFRWRAAGVAGAVGLLHVIGWGAAFLMFQGSPAAMGLAVVAYTLGLRHGFDADHIAAIDNFTRRMVGRGERPAAVGLCFSLGHSSVVIAASLLIAVAAVELHGNFAALRETAATYSTLLSVSILLIIAPLNFSAAYRLYRSLRRGERPAEEAPSGLLTYLLRPLLRWRLQSWQTFFVGILFGLGFETATAIALLGIAAAEATHGLPLSAVMIFPLLFTAGMTLVDSSEGVFMTGAYGWALVEPQRKLVYNLVVTFLSALTAVVVGAVQLLLIIPAGDGAHSLFWRIIDLADDHFEELGATIIVAFALIWIGALAINRLRVPAGAQLYR